MVEIVSGPSIAVIPLTSSGTHHGFPRVYPLIRKCGSHGITETPNGILSTPDSFIVRIQRSLVGPTTRRIGRRVEERGAARRSFVAVQGRVGSKRSFVVVVIVVVVVISPVFPKGLTTHHASSGIIARIHLLLRRRRRPVKGSRRTPGVRPSRRKGRIHAPSPSSSFFRSDGFVSRILSSVTERRSHGLAQTPRGITSTVHLLIVGIERSLIRRRRHAPLRDDASVRIRSQVIARGRMESGSVVAVRWRRLSPPRTLLSLL